ncbi:MAG: tetratricopeptide repeat protein [Bacteroidia bacterium]
MHRRLFTLLGILFFWAKGFAATPEDLFRAGNEAFTAQQYEQAVAHYDSLLAQGYVSADLYYNLGNAHFRLNHLSQALLSYERALKLNPQHADAAFNLRLANLRVVDRLETVPDFFLTASIRNFVQGRNSSQWAVTALVLLWLALAGGTLVLFGKASIWKRIGFFGGITLCVLSLGSLTLSLTRHDAETRSDWGIVLTPNAYVKAAPGGQTDLLILHEGAKVETLGREGDWMKVRVPVQDDKLGEVVDIIGYVPGEAIEEI